MVGAVCMSKATARTQCLSTSSSSWSLIMQSIRCSCAVSCSRTKYWKPSTWSNVSASCTTLLEENQTVLKHQDPTRKKILQLRHQIKWYWHESLACLLNHNTDATYCCSAICRAITNDQAHLPSGIRRISSHSILNSHGNLQLPAAWNSASWLQIYSSCFEYTAFMRCLDCKQYVHSLCIIHHHFQIWKNWHCCQ